MFKALQDSPRTKVETEQRALGAVSPQAPAVMGSRLAWALPDPLQTSGAALWAGSWPPGEGLTQTTSTFFSILFYRL